MRKADFLTMVLPLVKNKNYSDTDLRVTYNDEIENQSRNNTITPAQRQNWCPSAVDMRAMRKATKCNCQ